jgi:hypothetical protein
MTDSEHRTDSDRDRMTFLANTLPERDSEAFMPSSHTESAILHGSNTSEILRRYLQHVGSCKRTKKRRCISQELA